MVCAIENGMEESEVRRGPWTSEEDRHLIHYIALHGEGHWNLLAKQAGLKRTGKSCRLRWLNYLKPDVKRGNLSLQEQLLILQLHSKLGNRWSKIAQQLPGRTDNEIKNFWRTRVQKQARQLQLECNSHKFLDTLSFFCNPTNSSSSSSSLHNLNLMNSSETPNLHSILQPSSSSSNHSIIENQGFVQNCPEMQEHQPNFSAEFSNFPHRTQILNNDFQVETRSFDQFSSMGHWEVADFDGQVAAADWVLEDDMVGNLWNLAEF